MKRNNFDITTIERGLVEMIRKCRVSKNIYNNRPKSKVTTDDFVVVSLSSSIEDMETYAVASVGIDLFARNVLNIKNGKKLKYMYDMLIDNLPHKYTLTDASFQSESFDDSFSTGQAIAEFLLDSHPTILGDTPDDYDFTARIIELKIIIKAI